ncbi:MAG: hypothetical protein LBV67_09295, partial [Streptococcaceae bacterium]|nr:hypothetical protein [Streptococcaceae bacterium]
MSDDRRNKACGIIHSASVLAGATGGIPIPFADAFVIVPIQVAMITALYNIYGQSISEGLIKGVIKSTMLTTMGRQIVKFIPFVGWFVSAGVAAALTEAIGWATVSFLEEGKDILDDAEGFAYA